MSALLAAVVCLGYLSPPPLLAPARRRHVMPIMQGSQGPLEEGFKEILPFATEEGNVDPELVEHLHHAKRLFPSSSPTNVQLNLHSGSVDTRLPRLPSTGSRKLPTVVFTSTRPALTTW